MSESTEQSNSNDSSASTSPTPSFEQSIVEIDLNNLTDTQKFVLGSIPLALVIQLAFLFNMRIFTDFFKGMISGASYKPIADYVTDFLSTFVPYLVVFFVFFALYTAYVILVNDEAFLKVLNTVYYYMFIALVVDFILLFMSVSTEDPYTTEFFLLILVILIMGLIAWIPFGLYDLFEGRTKKLSTAN